MCFNINCACFNLLTLIVGNLSNQGIYFDLELQTYSDSTWSQLIIAKMSYCSCSEASIVTVITLCLLSAVMSLVEQRALYVLSHNSNHEVCPVEHCFTFKQVIENKEFVSNTKFVLFPAVHTLSDNFSMIFISNVSNIVITCGSAGDLSLCYIQCKGNAGFFFQNVTDVSISGINFENCGAGASNVLYGSSIVLLFRYCTNIIHSRVTVVGRMSYGIAVIEPRGDLILINTTLKGHSQGVCFYAAMDINNPTFMPLLTNLIMNNVSFVDDTYGSNDGALCHAILMQTEYYVKIHMTDIYIERCKVNILYYDVCKTDANLQRITVVNGYYSLNPDIILSAQMSSCDHQLTEWKRFVMTDVNFTNTIIQIIPFLYHRTTSESVIKLGIRFQIMFSNTVFQKCRDVTFMGSYEIIMSNVSFFKNVDTVVFANILLRIERLFRFERNLNGMTVMSDLLKWNRGSRITIANDTQVVFKDNTLSNSGSGTTMHVTSSVFDILDNTYVLFEGNVGSQCGGILLENSTMNLHPGKSVFLFSHNKGNKGGAMAFYATSRMQFICSTAEIAFTDNHAEGVGGAIYVHDFGSIHLVPNGVGYNYKPMLEEEFISTCQQSQVDLSFINNTAQLAGSALYGGWVDSKMYYYNFFLHQGKRPFFQLNNSGDDLSVVSSDPVRVCPCLEQTPNCNSTARRVELFPGQTFTIQAVAVGQRYGTAPATVQAVFEDSLDSHLEDTQYVQDVETGCTNLTFTLQSSAKTETIVLTINNRDMTINSLQKAVWVDN